MEDNKSKPWVGSNDSTPRTDAEVFPGEWEDEVVPASFARELELELQDALVLANNPPRPMYVTPKMEGLLDPQPK